MIRLAAIVLLAGCGAGLPEDVAGYDRRCVQMNATPIPPTADDPHRGHKNVFACHVPLPALSANLRPFPPGTIIVKESRAAGESAPWLVAVARKQADGTWQWDEYTRNFDDEELRHNLAGESICTGCHQRARPIDWIFTGYSR